MDKEENAEERDKIGRIGKFSFIKHKNEEREVTPPVARLQFKVKQKPEADESETYEKSPSLQVHRPDEHIVKKQKTNKTISEITAEIKKKKQQIALTNAQLVIKQRVAEHKQIGLKSVEVRHPEKRKRTFQEVKQPGSEKLNIEKEVKLIVEKLEFLGGGVTKLSKFQQMQIALKTRVHDYTNGEISERYMRSKVMELKELLRKHEENSVSAEWKCSFDR